MNTTTSKTYCHYTRYGFMREIAVYGNTLSHKAQLKAHGFTYRPDMHTPANPVKGYGAGWEFIAPDTWQGKLDEELAWIRAQGWELTVIPERTADDALLELEPITATIQ